MKTPDIIIASFVISDVTGTVANRMTNIVNQAVTLKSSTHLEKISLMTWVETQQIPRSSDSSNVPDELV